MENNRKPDQYYNDLYDRSTISSFKRLELQLQNTAKKFDESHKNVNQEDKQYATRLLHDMTILFYKGDHWKRKEQVINEWIRKDEEKDSLRMLNSNLNSIQIITYDDLVQFGKLILANFKR